MLKTATRIVERLREAGFEAYFAGGSVRDMLMGLEPHDIDIATSARPEQVMRMFEKVVPVGAKFGVVVVMLDGKEFEVATFRSDIDYLDGRRPERVVFSTAQEDAARRDFTINGLFYDPIKGQVIDYVGGQEDIRGRLVRTIGDPYQRFDEDKLRMMRAIRFACRFDFQIERETWFAIAKLADQITQVSQERIRDELLKILTEGGAGRGLVLLEGSGLLRHILPEVQAMVGVPQPPEFHTEGDVFTHTRMMLDMLSEKVKKGDKVSPELALGVLLHDVGKPPTFAVKERIRFDNHTEVGAGLAERICRRLRLSNDQIEQIVDLVRDHLKFIHVRQMRESTLKRFLAKPNFADHLELHRLDCLASHGDLRNWEFCRQKLEALKEEEIRPPRIITGDDLIALGYNPGPLFKRILSFVEDAQLEGKVSDKQQALKLVKKHFPL